MKHTREHRCKPSCRWSITRSTLPRRRCQTGTCRTRTCRNGSGAMRRVQRRRRPPKEVEYRTSPKYEDDRRRFESYQMFLQQGWVSDFHAQHPSAEHFALIANGCKGHARGRATLDRLCYKECCDLIWWPTFEHHARTVVMNKHSHEHCKSCTKTKRGKVGCRYCASWPHDVERTRCMELRMPKDWRVKKAADETVCQLEDNREGT